MTVQEENKQDMDIAISHMQVLKDWLGDSLTQKSFKESIDVAIESMEKQIPRKPKKMEKDAINDLDTWVECSCGAMKKMDTEKHKLVYCWKCGQLLSWEEGGTSD